MSMARCLLKSVLMVALTGAPVFAQDGYMLPPKPVVDIVDAKPFPEVMVSPDRARMLIIERASMPGIADLAQPRLGLAGARINPNTFGPHGGGRIMGILIRDLATGRETRVRLPEDASLDHISWSPNGAHVAFSNTSANGIHLWMADPQTGAVRRVTEARLNATSFSVCGWLADSARMLCRFVPEALGPVPVGSRVPSGPVIQETSGPGSPARTYPDLLANPHDEALYEHYFTSQLALVDVLSGARSNLGSPAIFANASLSPNGEYILVTRIVKPYSYQVAQNNFPRVTEVWDRGARVVHRVANYPLESDRPFTFVTTLPRNAAWRATAPATLVWAEALDEGNPRKEAAQRDKLLMLDAPFTGTAREIARLPERYAGLAWLENGAALLTDYKHSTRWRRTWLINPDSPETPWTLLWDLSVENAYKNPGNPAYRPGTTHPVILQRGDAIYLTGPGSTPQGDQPFLDRFNLKTRTAERLWQTASTKYESVVALVDDAGHRIITRRESITEPPNLYLRDLQRKRTTALTNFPDPAPQLAGITKQRVTYTRADGVPLSATLYLPPGYKPGTRLPVVMWAYPEEFASADVAGQIRGSTNRFTTVRGISHLFFLTQGYAIFDNPTIPIVGGDTANNTYVEQLVAGATAAVDKVVEMGIGDRHRIGIGGHSYGAFMTANLLAHSDLFRAGIARSGAFNRTLTPFGFQAEERTFWEAPDVYSRMSPFNYAHRIKEPILLIHGADDNNTGTFPVQSERMYAALRGQGATARYVVLPFESHGYLARESVLHTLAEMINWFDKHVKNAKPVAAGAAGS